jgi:hypothetical protein
VQGVGGAFDMGQEFLAALRKRCDETGALADLRRGPCGVGRTGQPFAANYYGVMPDMITTAKALGNGFPVSALLLTPPITAALKLENLGTTFGGGPMACAVAEATIDAIEKEDLLANVRRVSAYLVKTCAVGTGSRLPGRGLPRRPQNEQTGQGHPEGAARQGHPGRYRGRSVDPSSAPGFHPKRGAHRPAARRVDRTLMNNFLDLADLQREQVTELLALAERLAQKPEPHALAGKILGLLFFNPSLRTLASFQAAMARLGWQFVRDLCRPRAPGSSRPGVERS